MCLHRVYIIPPPRYVPPLNPGGTGRKPSFWNTPGSPAVKNPPADAGDVGSILSRGMKIPCVLGNEACVLQLQSPRTRETVLHYGRSLPATTKTQCSQKAK